MTSGTNEWQRVDNSGCVAWVLRVFLLGWAIIIPYAAFHGDVGWTVWSCSCVALGAALAIRDRQRNRSRSIPGIAIEIQPDEVRLGEWLVVRLRVSGEYERAVRWWKASVVAVAVDEHDDEEEVAIREMEFAVDPSAYESPVTELEMMVGMPTESETEERVARAAYRVRISSAGIERPVPEVERWYLRVTVETERGRMESGRVGIRLLG